MDRQVPQSGEGCPARSACVDEENEADMNMSERVAFAKDILKQINEEINGKKA